ncbi:MAG: carbamoyltransferase HypF [Chloroflexota bacterium]|nr:carbamoyltransferase HypF [Chloroflexota bacterium]
MHVEVTFEEEESDQPLQRLRLVIRGAVQGVGFRPFIYRLASEMELHGWVLNSAQGVFVEVEGISDQLECFRSRVEREKPPRALIESMEFSFLDPVGFTTFEIHHSDEAGAKTVVILPDIATCPDCLREIFDRSDRRYRYPFTNCTNCGPRYTIVEALPYDRPNTTMRNFVMCERCQAEYDNPLDRRFHAQPNACPRCGPYVELWDPMGRLLASHDDALRATADAIRRGEIIAVKGVGGYHLMVDARDEQAVLRLRARKHRQEKPLALMAPSLEWVKATCEVSELEEELLRSPEAPIVLLRAKTEANTDLVASIAPGNPYLGVMLPYTPLHHLLMTDLGIPVVATSGNLSEEPICINENEALERLRSIADLFLVHNRPIKRHTDDSVVRVTAGREMVLRRARGYAPLPIPLPTSFDSPVLAVGAHLKNTVALAVGHNGFISQHIGDLEALPAFGAFQQVIRSFETLYDAEPTAIACDAHPDYLSTQYAERSGRPVIAVQHHYAHVLSCMADNQLEGQVLGVSWDGTGYGLDGTVWGGEFLQTTEEGFQRVALLRPFRLPGGGKAVKEPRRAALGLLFELFGEEAFEMRELAPVRAFSEQDLSVLRTMLHRGLNAPYTSSAGRLFDAVASILDLRQYTGFEGQAAMAVEFALEGVEIDDAYAFPLGMSPTHDPSPLAPPRAPLLVNWGPMVQGILNDVRSKIPVGIIAAKFHNTLTEMIVALAEMVDEEQVVLTGGCFQNQYLAEHTIRQLRNAGFRPYWHHRVPPNDGGIALGQLVAALRSGNVSEQTRTHRLQQK